MGGDKGKKGKKGKGKRRPSDMDSDDDSSPSPQRRGKSTGSSGGKGYTDLGARTIYCGNLSWSVSWQDLKDFCKEIGEVEHAECLQYADGRKTGSGIVRFKRAEDAAKAIKDYNDADLKGRPIFIREDKEGGKGPGSKGKGKQALPDHMAEKQVYVGNLSYRTSWQTLKDHMAWIGEVEFCDVMLNRDGDKAGYGLVRYKDKKDAARAIDELVDSYLDGRKIFVREDKDGFAIKGASDKGKGKKGGKGGKEWSVWVGPIDKELDWKELKDAFKKYAPTHTTVGEIRNGKNRGFGIVKFAKASEAERAIEEVTEVGGEKVTCKWDNEG